jgi:hypothetical protein
MTLSPTQSAIIWQYVVEQHQSGSDHGFAEAVHRSLSSDVDRVAMLRHALLRGGIE